jgi:hypothetical protein
MIIAVICVCFGDAYSQSNNANGTSRETEESYLNMPAIARAFDVYIWDQCFAMEQSLRIE